MKYRIFTLFICLLFLNACGSVAEKLGAAAPQPLRVQFVLPTGITPTFFWGDVSQKSFFWREEGVANERQFSPEQAASLDWDFSRGVLRFEGRDQSGNLLVKGETTVRDEKQIFLPLQRVL